MNFQYRGIFNGHHQVYKENNNGLLIKQITLEDGINEVNMSGFIEGIYIFKTENGEIERVVKL